MKAEKENPKNPFAFPMKGHRIGHPGDEEWIMPNMGMTLKDQLVCHLLMGAARFIGVVDGQLVNGIPDNHIDCMVDNANRVADAYLKIREENMSNANG
jgi:hypothetical protein